MSSGLCNATQTFYRLVNDILQEPLSFFMYLDDFLVASSSKEEHEVYMREVFSQLFKHCLITHPEECAFGVSVIHFLGHQVSASRITIHHPTQQSGCDQAISQTSDFSFSSAVFRSGELLSPLHPSCCYDPVSPPPDGYPQVYLAPLLVSQRRSGNPPH